MRESRVFTEGKERTVWVWSRGCGGTRTREECLSTSVTGLSYFLCKSALHSRTLYIMWAR